MLRFVGAHNRVKALSFLLLSQFPHWGYSAIASTVGSSPAAMSVLLRRWVRWGYVTRSGGRGSYTYTVTPLAVAWLNKHLREMPLDSWLSTMPDENKAYFNKVYAIWCQAVGEG